jgi:ABC-type transport system involved in multi-copper enzyme maturation permease subunit
VGRQILAILGDSLREARDRRSLFVLLVLATVVIVSAFGVSFHGGTPGEALAEQARSLGRMTARRAGAHAFTRVEVDYQVGEPRAARADELAGGGQAIELRFATRGDAETLARAWQRFHADPLELAAEDAGEAAAAPVDVRAFLEGRFGRYGYERVAVVERAADPAAFTVAVRSAYPHEVQGLHHVRLFFGALEVPLRDLSVAELVVGIQLALADSFAGFLGMLVAIVVTAGFVPNLLQKGTLDLVLARPIPRGRLLLAKYLGGLWFVFLIAAYLFVGVWLGLSLRTGFSNPAFLLCVLTVTAQFGVLYTVSTLAGVLTRSSGVASLATLCVWGLSSVVVNTRQVLPAMFGQSKPPGWLGRTLDTLYTILPKTTDIAHVNSHFLSRSHLSPEALRRTLPDLPRVDWLHSLGTTAAFAALMLGLAVWVFRRRDY